MIQLEAIKSFFPAIIRENALFDKHIIKEYLQLLILDYLSNTSYIRKIVFIGGTNLRLVKGIDRFSEDLDFDCKDLSQDEFMKMTDDVLLFLQRNGLSVIARDKVNPNLRAFRRSIYFPELLFDLGLSGHKEERFLIKVESQDQQIEYNPVMVFIKGCGFFFPFPVPTDEVMCAMKLSAMISRSKGRDFYDAIFLLSQTAPDYNFLAMQRNIHNLEELKTAVAQMLSTVDLNQKQRDFEHLLFNKMNSKRILNIGEFIETLK